MISIVAPAYNEQDNIQQFIGDCLETIKKINQKCEVVLVEDGSTDKTKQIIQENMSKIPHLTMVEHKYNKGYLQSLKDGLKGASGDYIVTIDSDLQYDIKNLPTFVKKLKEGYDAVCGVRLKKEDTFLRRIMSRGFVFFTNILFLSAYKDTQCIFRLFKKKAMDNINLTAKGFQIPTEMILKWRVKGIKIGFVDVLQKERVAGTSTFKAFNQIVYGFFFLFYLRYITLLYQLNLRKEL